MKMFVTGGAGFIGSNYVRHVLATSDDDVTVYDALTYAGNLANLREVEDDPRYRFVKGDITDRPTVEEAMAGHDAVVHFAAESHVDRSIVSPDEFVHTNCDGTNVIMDVARRLDVSRVLHISTDEVYGSIEQGSFGEDDRAGVDLVLRTGEVGEIYNIGAGNEIPNRVLTEKILALLGADESMINYVEDRLGHDRRYSIATDKVEALGWRPKHDLDEALAATVEWYGGNRAWWEPLKAG